MKTNKKLKNWTRISLLFLMNIQLIGLGFSQSFDSNPIEFNNPVPGDDFYASPEVSEFQKLKIFPTNLYTGKVDVSIPLYEIKEGAIEVPIYLRYNSGGVKVDQYSTSVGLGWSLDAGGNVTRVIKDIEDNKLSCGSFSDPDMDFGAIATFYVSGQGYFIEEDFYELSTACIPGYISMGTYGWGPTKKDTSPDLFFVNAPGLNENFHLEKISEDRTLYKGIFHQSKGYKMGNVSRNNILEEGTRVGFVKSDIPLYDELISDTSGYATQHVGAGGSVYSEIPRNALYESFWDYQGFNIINDKGVLYRFNEMETTESVSDYIPKNRFGEYRDIWKSLVNSYQFGVSAWGLTKIEDSVTGGVVDFEYESYQQTSALYNRTHFDDKLRNNPGGSPFCKFNHVPVEYWRDNNTNSNENLLKASGRYIKQGKINRIKYIDFSKGKVEFKYDLERLDVPNEKALTDVIIYDENEQKIKHYKFNYSYFISKENCNDYECKRLKLNSIEGIDIDDFNRRETLYSFDYYYTNGLPKVKSLEQDFFGYYNNNGVVTPELGDVTTRKTPTVYYHKNKGKYSILPFPLSSGLTRTIVGDFSLIPNDYSLTGLLKKITYPTGGSSEFIYENHKFNLLGDEYRAGGARIKEQKINDGIGGVRNIRYLYKLTNGKSSGFINNIPTFGYPWKYDDTRTSNNISFFIYDKARAGIELTDGAFVGYSRIIEKEESLGETIYEYTSPNDYPNEPETYSGTFTVDVSPKERQTRCLKWLFDNSSYPSDYFVDNDIRRGKLLFKSVYSNSGNLLSKQTNSYTYKNFDEIELNYNRLLVLNTDIRIPPHGWNIQFNSKINIERNLHTERETTEYLDGNPVTTVKETVYDEELPLIKQERITNSLGEELKSTYKYVWDERNGSNSIIQDMISQNRLSELLESEIKKNNQIISKSKLVYSVYNDFILPSYLKNAKGNQSLEIETKYLEYDDKGNVVRYKEKNGTTTLIVWGYNKQYPIAKIVNPPLNDSDFEDIIANAINASSQDDTNCIGAEILGTCWESRLRGILNLARNNFPKAQITTYTYDPLVGVTSITPPNGQTAYYEYDGFGRLESVKDEAGNKVQDIQYHYRPTP